MNYFTRMPMDIFQLVTQILTAIGLWKIFRKCGEKGWWALIPGLHFYKLAECAGREKDGQKCLVLEVLVLVADIARRFTNEGTRPQYLLALGTLALVLILVIYEIRVILGLCETFGVTRWWTALWVVAPWFPALRWGLLSKYQPINLGKYRDDELLAGTTPVTELALPMVIPDVKFVSLPRDEGLHIHIKERIAKDFVKTRYLLKDINLEIPNGSFVLLLGGSGSGKTTLVNAITGYEKADAEILLNGEDVYKNYENMKYRIGFVPQQDLMRQYDTVMNTLKDAASLRLPTNIRGKEKRERIRNVIDTLGLAGRESGLVTKKSGGQKKRISIGMELIADPELFILDEPDSGLDGVIARELFEKLRSIADTGRIVIAITHTPDRVADLFDKIIVLAKDSGRVGRLAFYGSPDEARRFFGKESMEKIVMAVNNKSEGGEGRADEFIGKYTAARISHMNAKGGSADAS